MNNFKQLPTVRYSVPTGYVERSHTMTAQHCSVETLRELDRDGDVTSEAITLSTCSAYTDRMNRRDHSSVPSSEIRRAGRYSYRTASDDGLDEYRRGHFASVSCPLCEIENDTGIHEPHECES